MRGCGGPPGAPYNRDVGDTWDQRIRRASHLAARADAASSLLTFYGELLSLQKQLYDALAGSAAGAPSGDVDCDTTVLAEMFPSFLHAIAATGPALLAAEARERLTRGVAAHRDVLRAYWLEPSDTEFFAKAVVQPYAQWCAEASVLAGRDGGRWEGRRSNGGNRCPFCGGAPQVSILDEATSGDGATRSLQCGTCLTLWPFRRVVCAWCGEEDEHKLAYLQSPTFEHLRLDACETCRRYVKTVDRTRLGMAVPLVDEVAGAALDLWARDHGYQKIELNLVGL